LTTVNKLLTIQNTRQQERLQPTWGLLQLGLDVEAIIGSAYPGFSFGGRNSAGLLLVNFGF
jgi:hypothetical protein